MNINTSLIFLFMLSKKNVKIRNNENQKVLLIVALKEQSRSVLTSECFSKTHSLLSQSDSLFITFLEAI